MSARASTIAPLPDNLTARGGDPALVGKELLSFIEHGISQQPRSLQKRIGPSELGHPCARRLGYKLMGHDEVNTGDVPWLPFIGTAVHAALEGIFDQANLRIADGAIYENPLLGVERFLIESKVTTCQMGDDEIDGSTDLYDRVTATVIDWKVVGKTQLQKYASKGPGDQYRSQGHLYGRGWKAAGHPVDNVMIVFLPRNGPLGETVIWHEPYDEQIALDAAQRAEGIRLTVAAMGTASLPLLSTADAYCNRCPYFRADSTDLSTGCPGDENARKPGNPFADLMAG